MFCVTGVSNKVIYLSCLMKIIFVKHWKFYKNTLKYSRITDSLEPSPSWEANSSSASRQISCILWNPTFHYRVHSIKLLLYILSQMNPVHAFQSITSEPFVNCPPIYAQIFQVISLHWGFTSNIQYALFSPFYMPHVPLISVFLISSPE
jgi:hypothetical protein